MTTVAVLGTGTMGAPMALNLARAKLTVRAWNRSVDKAAQLAEYGMDVYDEPAEAVAGTDVVLTMLSDADAVAEVFGEVADALDDDVLWLQMSTVGVAGADRLADLATRRGVAQVDAPVVGTKQPAERGELLVLAAGAPELRERAGEVFDVVGKQTRWVGDRPGAASALKVVVNGWLLALTDAAAEALALAGGLGLDPRLFLDAIAGSPVDVAYAHLKGDAMLAGRFPAAFALRHALKDAGLVVEAAQRAGVPVRVAAAVRDDFAAAAELGHGDDDLAAVYRAHDGR